MTLFRYLDSRDEKYIANRPETQKSPTVDRDPPGAEIGAFEGQGILQTSVQAPGGLLGNIPRSAYGSSQ